MKLLTLTALGSLLWGSMAIAANNFCPGGAITNQTVNGNVIVPSGQGCTISNSTIQGNVKAEPGHLFVIFSVSIVEKNVQIKGGVEGTNSSCTDTTINGSYQAQENFNSQVIVNCTVRGNVQISDNIVNDIVVAIGDISGNFQISNNNGNIDVFNNIVNGNLQISENSVDPLVAAFNIFMNTISGNLQFFKNNSGSNFIINNGVGGNLQCGENNPDPVVSGNTVEGNTECAD